MGSGQDEILMSIETKYEMPSFLNQVIIYNFKNMGTNKCQKIKD